MPVSPPACTDVASWLTSPTSLVHDSHARAGSRFQKCSVQRGPTHATPSAALEWRIDPPVAVQVADPTEWLARCLHAEAVQLAHGVWHQPFAAGLVDRSAAPFDDDDLQSRPGTVHCGGQSGRATARDKQVNQSDSPAQHFRP